MYEEGNKDLRNHQYIFNNKIDTFKCIHQ